MAAATARLAAVALTRLAAGLTCLARLIAAAVAVTRLAAGLTCPARLAAAACFRLAAAAGPAPALAFPSAAVAVTAANVTLVFRRRAVLALSHRGSTRMVACFALAIGVVRCQSRRRASKHEEKSGHEDERVDGQAPREHGSTG